MTKSRGLWPRSGVVELYRDAFRGLPERVWWLAAAGLVHRAGTMVVPFLTLYLTSQRGFSVRAAGAILASFGIGAACGVFLGGRLTDRYGSKPVQIWSLALGGVLFLVLGAARGTPAIAAAAVILGLVLEAFRPANSSAFAVAAPAGRRTQTFGLYRLAVNLGMSIGPVLGGVLALVDYQWLFVANAIACWLAAALLAAKAPSFKPVEEAAAGEDEAAARDRSPWRDTRYLVVLGLLFLQGLVFFQLMSTLPLYMREEMGMREDAVGFVFATNTVLIVLFEMALIRVVQNRDPLRIAAFASLCFGVGYGLLPWGSGPGFAVFTVSVWTVGEMLSAPVMMSYAADRAGSRNLGSYMGAFNLCFAAAAIVAPSLGTWIWALAGPEVLWHGTLGLGALISLAFLYLARSAPR